MAEEHPPSLEREDDTLIAGEIDYVEMLCIGCAESSISAKLIFDLRVKHAMTDKKKTEYQTIE